MEIIYSGGDGGSLWMVDREEIDAHLVFLSVDVGEVSVTIDKKVIQGVVQTPSQHRLVPFVPDARFRGLVRPPAIRTPVRLDYVGPSDTYTFHSRVMDLDGDRWLLCPPRAIERSDRRIVFRHLVMGHPDIQLKVEGSWLPRGPRPFPVYDISTDGLAFLFMPGRTPIGVHDIFSSTLVVASHFQAALTLHVAYTRRLQADSPRSVAGVRFLDLPLEERMALARAVSVWELNRMGSRS